MRQRFSFGNGGSSATASSHQLRQSITRLRDEFQLEDMDYDDDDEEEEESENNNDEENDTPSLSQQIPKTVHPLVGRIGTIATVQHTHERTTMYSRSSGNDDGNNNTNSSSSLWRRYEDAPELVFTAVGTSRFRILSCINDDDNTDAVQS